QPAQGLGRPVLHDRLTVVQETDEKRDRIVDHLAIRLVGAAEDHAQGDHGIHPYADVQNDFIWVFFQFLDENWDGQISLVRMEHQNGTDGVFSLAAILGGDFLDPLLDLLATDLDDGRLFVRWFFFVLFLSRSVARSSHKPNKSSGNYQ